MHNGGPVILQGRGIAQERVDGNLCRDPDVGQVHGARRPLGDVEQPLARRVSLEQVCKLKILKIILVVG